MLPLSFGGYVVDTPGIREFGVAGLSRGELVRFYRIAAVAGNCHFHDLLASPRAWLRGGGCRAAGLVSKARYHNYEKILMDLRIE